MRVHELHGKELVMNVAFETRPPLTLVRETSAKKNPVVAGRTRLNSIDCCVVWSWW
jgi:hypothetical protein